MAWNVVIEFTDNKSESLTLSVSSGHYNGFCRSGTGPHGEVVGFFIQDPKTRAAIKARDPCILNALNEAIEVTDELSIAMWAAGLGLDWNYQIGNPDIEQYKVDLHTLLNSRFASDEDKEIAQDYIRALKAGDQPIQNRKAAKGKVKQKAERSRDGYVYLMRADNGTYKIGLSRDPEIRCKNFSIELPFEIAIIHTIKTPDMYALEKELHKHFADKRLGGEWFELSDADVDYIKNLKKL